MMIRMANSSCVREAENQSQNRLSLHCMKPDPAAVRPEAEAQRLLHELEVHQIELQTQNVELRLARNEAEAVIEKYTDLYDFAPVAYFTLGSNGSIQLVNLTGSHLVGIHRSRLIGRSFGLLVSPEFRPAFKELLRQVFEDPTKQSIETELLYQDRPPTAVTIEVQRSPDGRECRVVAMDITERKRGEAAAAQLVAIVESSDDAIIGKNLRGVVTSWNRGAERIFGYMASEMIGQSITRLIPPERQAEEVNILAMIGRGERLRHFETLRIRKDGSAVDVSVTVSAIKDVAGKIVGVSKLAHDITQRKQVEEELLKSQELLVMAIDGGRFGIWSWDLIADQLVWNARCKEIVGLPADTEMNLAVALGAIHPEDRARINGEITRALEIRVAVQFECRVVWPDRSVHWMHMRGCTFEDVTGKPICFTGTMLDVTERREAEEELRRFNAELESQVRERTAVIEVKLLELREEIAERRRLEVEILGIGERARSAIGQDLHDDLGQQLVSIGILMDLLSGELTAEAHPRAADALQLTTFLTRSLVTTRNLAKSLYPVELERGGLILSLEDLARRTELLSGVVCTVHSDDAFWFAKSAEIHLYRIVQESISNSLKHGKAHHIAIECTALRGTSTLTVTDDGSGFVSPVAGIGAGIGLHLFQYRARLIGAAITVTLGKNGGCLVTCTMGKPAAIPGG